MNKYTITYYGPNKMSFGESNFITFDGISYKLFLNGISKVSSKDIENLYEILKKEFKNFEYEGKPRKFIVEATPNKINYLVYSLGYILREDLNFVVCDQFNNQISKNTSLEEAVDALFNLSSGIKLFRLKRTMFNYKGLLSETLSTDGNLLVSR